MGDGGRPQLRNPSTPPIGDLGALLADPSRWSALDLGLLGQLYYHQCLSCALSQDEAAARRLTALAQVAAERLHPAVRRDLAIQVARAIEHLHRERQVREGGGCTGGLRPFLLEDPDPSVVAAAAAEMAVLQPLEEGDPLTGPRFVASLIGQLATDDARAGLLAGLLQLGDDRVEPLLSRGWALLGEDGRLTLALLIQGFRGLTPMTARFLLSWLEEEVRDPLSPSFGVVAATMARAGRHAADHGVVEVRRAFPVVDAIGGQPAAVVRQLTRAECVPVVAERLVRVAALECPPRLMLSVLSHWGLNREAYELGVEHGAQAARGRGTGAEGILAVPEVLEISPAWGDQTGVVVEWGGDGPAVDTLRLTPVRRVDMVALVQTRYRPTGSASRVLALVAPDAGERSLADLLSALCAAAPEASPWPGSLPDYLHVPASSPLGAAALIDALARGVAAAGLAGVESVRPQLSARAGDARVHEARGRLAAAIEECWERGTMAEDP